MCGINTKAPKAPMPKAAEPLCRHVFFGDCPSCEEDKKIVDLLDNALTLLCYTTGLYQGASMRYKDLDEDTTRRCFENMKFATETRAILDNLKKRDIGAMNK